MDIFNNAKNFGFGLMRLPSLDPNDPGKIDIELCKKMVDCFIERGFTYFDTALMYCNSRSESAVKEFLTSRYPREAYTLTTKLHSMYLKTEADCDRMFNGQLEKTGVSYFDYYLIHDINVHSLEVYNKFHVFDWIKAKKDAGLIRHMGFSFHDTPELLDRVLTEHPEMEFIQIQLNYLDYYNPAIRSKECYDIAVKHGKQVIVMEPVKGGTLVNLSEEVREKFRSADPDADAASWALRFAASHANVRMVLSGMSNLEQVEANTAVMQNFKPLTDEEQKTILEVRDILEKSVVIPCTACAYCTTGCPKNIAIPKYFALYNAEMRENPENTRGWTPQKEYYENLTKNFGKASECVECRQCESVCPQHLPITKYLKTLVERFEEE